MSKLNIMWDSRWPSLTVEERRFVETHRLIQEAAAVARQINQTTLVRTLTNHGEENERNDWK